MPETNNLCDQNRNFMPCKAKNCIANINNECTVPSLIKIGIDRKCEGYRKVINKRKK